MSIFDYISENKKGSIKHKELQETIQRHVYLYGTQATLLKMVEAMSQPEADYMINLILEHGDFDERE
jgi:hypothetical protein